MNLSAKMLAAGAALRSAYADIQQLRLGKKFTAKMRAAVIALAERYDAVRQKVDETRQYEPLTAVPLDPLMLKALKTMKKPKPKKPARAQFYNLLELDLTGKEGKK